MHVIFILCSLAFRSQEFLSDGVRYPGTGVRDKYDLPCGCRELNLGPLEEQSILLSVELSHLSSPCFLYF